MAPSPKKLLNGTPVIDLKFKLFNRKRKATPALRLKSWCRISIVNMISGSFSCALRCSCALAYNPFQATAEMNPMDRIRQPLEHQLFVLEIGNSLLFVPKAPLAHSSCASVWPDHKLVTRLIRPNCDFSKWPQVGHHYVAFQAV